MKKTNRIHAALTAALCCCLIFIACSNKEPSVADDPANQLADKTAQTAVTSAEETKHEHAEHAAEKPALKNGFDGMPAPGTEAYCPVMKQDFKVKADSTFSIYKGKTYVFCCPGCKPQFEADPEKFL